MPWRGGGESSFWRPPLMQRDASSARSNVSSRHRRAFLCTKDVIEHAHLHLPLTRYFY
jgi:hypothetical protein